MENKRKCKGCGIDISHKHINAKFHSKKCKNKYWNKINWRKHASNKHLHNEDEIEDIFHPFSMYSLGQW